MHAHTCASPHGDDMRIHMFIQMLIHIRTQKYLTVAVAYGTCTMPIWRTTTCPKTLIVTLGDVLESGNAKKPRQSNLFCLC